MAGADERMTIATYLEHRRWVEVAAVVSTMFLVAATQTTTEVIDNLRQGLPSDWLAAAAKELTSGVAVLAMLPALVAFLRWLDPRWSNLRWRVLWHVPAFLVFSFGHILLFTLMRILIWAAAGDRYNTGPLGLGLLYEMRKDLLLYLVLVAVVGAYRFILDRLQGEAHFLGSEEADAGPEYRDRFLVKMLDREYLVRVDQVEWIGSASNYVLLHCGGRSYPMRYTLTRLAADLDPVRFLRVHRTAIVNLDQVRAVDEGAELRVELVGGARVPVSRSGLPALRAALAGRDGDQSDAIPPHRSARPELRP
jgi:hypothetical protein